MEKNKDNADYADNREIRVRDNNKKCHKNRSRNGMIKTTFREIRSSFGRFFAIFAIIALGVGFFAGLKVTKGAITDTVEGYLDKHGFYDLRLLSTLGFEQEDVDFFAAREDVEAAEGGLSFDVIYRTEDGNQGVARTYSLTEKLNTVKLVAGRLPSQSNECVADSAIFGEGSIGSTLYISEDNAEEDKEHFAHDAYKIVGIVQSPLYLQYERGNTSLGNGRLDGFLCLRQDGYDADYYTDVYVKFNQENALYSEGYKELIKGKTGSWENYADTAADRRYEEILTEAEGELAEAEGELADARAEGEEELADAAAKLADARRKLADGEKELADGKKEIAENEAILKEKEQELADARKEIEQAEAELADGEAQLAEKEAELADGRTRIAEAEAELAEGEAEFAQGEAELADGEAQLKEKEQELADGEAELARGEAELADGEAELTEAEAELADGEAQIEQKERELADAEAKLTEREQELADGEARLAEAGKQWEAGKSRLEDVRKEVDAGKAQLDAGRQQLSEEREKLKEMAAAGYVTAEQYQAGMAELEAGEKELDAREAQLKEAEVEVDQGFQELSASREQLEAKGKELEAGHAALAGARQQLADGRAVLEASKAELEAGAAEIAAGWGEIAAGRAELAAAEKELEEGRIKLADARKELEDGRRELEDAAKELENGRRELADARKELEDGRGQLADARKELEDGRRELEDARTQVADGEKQIEEGWQELAKAVEDVRQGEAELADARKELADGEKEYEDALREFQEKTGDAETELADAREELEDLEEPDTYVLGRDTNIGYVCFESDSNIVEGIANIFPIFFFLVAALVCITTMNRMVEEQRTQIGVLKALGYGEAAVMSKYLAYSGLAALGGCVFGFLLGTWGFPKVIWYAYGIMYRAEPVSYVFDWKLAVISLAVSLLCSMGTTWLSCRVELKEPAAVLMRPKAPKAGKRILLEKIPFLWSRLGFLRKVSLRNIFRYKKRLFMMVVGISGCTALLVTGFGIEDSIGDVAKMQFHEIQIYDIGVTLKDGAYESFGDKLENIADRYGIEAFAPVTETTFDLVAQGGVKPVYLVAGTADTMPEFLDMHTVDGKDVPYPGVGEAVISNKLADVYHIAVGDTITLRDDDMKTLALTVSAVYENYINNYVQISEETWRQGMGSEPEKNTVYINMSDTADAHGLSAALMGFGEVANVTVNADTMDRVNNMMASLDLIVLVVVLCAAGLAFIVLYNLTNINITERVREIATIKVLGFYKKETASYVFRENILLTLLGGALGLLLGRFLHSFVMSQIQVDLISFDVYIRPVSYGYSILLTLVFTILVNLFMGGKLEKISMTESLKSVD